MANLVKFNSWLEWTAGFKRLENLGYEIDGQHRVSSDYRDYLYQVKNYRYLLVDQESKSAMPYNFSIKNLPVINIKEVK